MAVGDGTKIKHVAATLSVLAGLSLITWLVHFWYIQGFGYFQDDYILVLPKFESPMNTARTMPSGRPLGFLMVCAIADATREFGLIGQYLAAYVSLTLSAIVLYLYFRKLSQNSLFALLGALFFIVYPLDLTRTWLTIAFFPGPGLLLLLVALLLHIHRFKVLSHLVAASTLMIYESIYPLFAIVPWLEAGRNGETPALSTLLKHYAAMAICLIVYVALRMHAGEARLQHLDISVTVQRTISHSLLGPVFCIQRSVTAISQGLRELLVFSPQLGIAILSVVFVLLMTAAHQPDTASNRPDFRLILCAIVLIMMGYPLTILYDVGSYTGCLSRAHFAASLGASLLFAAVTCRLWTTLERRGGLLSTVLIASTYLTSLAGLAVWRQKADVSAWQHERAFWSDVTRLCPDLSPQTVIVVPRKGLEPSKNMELYTNMTMLVLPMLFDFPKAYGADGTHYPPRLFVVSERTPQGDLSDLDWLWLKPYPNPRWILLEVSTGRLVRSFRSFTLGGRNFEAIRPPMVTTRLSPTELHSLMTSHDEVLPPTSPY